MCKVGSSCTKCINTFNVLNSWRNMSHNKWKAVQCEGFVICCPYVLSSCSLLPMKRLLVWASKASLLRQSLRAFRPFCSQSFVWTCVIVFNSETFHLAQRFALCNSLETPGDLVANMLNKCNIGMNATASLGQWPRKDASDRFTPAEREVWEIAHEMQKSNIFVSALALDSQLESSSVGGFTCTGFLCASFSSLSLFSLLDSFGLLNLLKLSNAASILEMIRFVRGHQISAKEKGHENTTCL